MGAASPANGGTRAAHGVVSAGVLSRALWEYSRPLGSKHNPIDGGSLFADWSPSVVYTLNDNERKIIQKSKKNRNEFTDFYLRGDSTGTWWRPVTVASEVPEIKGMIDRWTQGYERLREKWILLDRIPEFWHREKLFRVVIEEDPDYPAFHNHHGFLFQDWQLEAVTAPQSMVVMIAGYGSGKTMAVLADMLYLAATVPGFRALALAPHSIQANAIYDEAKLLFEGTLYKQRFVTSMPTKPYKRIVIENDLVGQNEIVCYSIGDGPEKIKTLSVDYIFVDQAEDVEDMEYLISVAASRFRGQVRGRPRMSKLVFAANSEDNPQLWDLFDEAETDPEGVKAITATTFDNIYNTPKQLKEIERRVGANKHMKDQHLRAQRPIGSGEHFPAETIRKIHAHWLDIEMEKAIAGNIPGWKLQSVPKAQVVQWEMPYDPKNIYLTIADPGTANPPYRNSAAIMVWNITGFPKNPAHLTAFSWVFGHGSPNPWIDQYYTYVQKYNCITRNGFDATGPQSGYEDLVYIIQEVMAEKFYMTSGRKWAALNAAKVMCSHGLIQVPSLPLLQAQMSKYRIPDDKIAQDLVMCLSMSCLWLERLWHITYDNEQEEPEEEQRRPTKRHSREVNRRRPTRRHRRD